MTEKKKKILFYSLFASFFLVGYLALLFAFGYTYDFGNHEFVKTGSIYISTNTSASVRIGDSKPKDTGLLRNDISRKYMLPGIYTIQITKDGFHTWTKKTEVPAGLVASFQNIVLIPKDLNATTLLPTLKELRVSEDGEHIFYKDINKRFGIIDLKDPKIEPSDSRLSFDIKIFSWDDERNLIFVSNYATSKIIGDEEIIIPTPTKLLNASLVLVDNYLVALSNGSVLIYDYRKGAFEKSIGSVSSFTVEDKILYYINSEDNLLYSYNLGNKRNTLVSGVDNFKGGLILDAELVNDDLYILIKGISQKFLFKVNEESIELLASNITDFKLSSSKEKIVFWSNNQISVYWIKDSKTQPFRKAGEKEEIFSTSNITNVFWHKHNGGLLVFTKQNIIFVETDIRHKVNKVVLFDVLEGDKTGFINPIENGVYNPDSDNIYFQVGRELKKIELE